jgi:dolichol-phosphate mannosyltransferase
LAATPPAPPDRGHPGTSGTDGVAVSVVVPALREAENLPALVARASAALADRDHEIIIVDDDSRDGTVEACAKLSRTYPVRLHVRQAPRDGLGGAVVQGLKAARGSIFVVIDADLQHPPEAIPRLVGPLERHEADFAVGSRNVRGGSAAERWTAFRRLNSWVATMLARPFSKGISDPMSGFFALRRATFQQADRLSPLGYKIGLELMCKCRIERPVEIPIHFSLRQSGRSKLSLREQFRYLEHLSRLYDYRFPRAAPCAKFLVTLGLGWLVAWAALFSGFQRSLSLPSACSVAYVGVLVVTALFHARYVRAQREFMLTSHPWRDFGLIAGAELLACSGTAFWLAESLKSPTPLRVSGLSFFAASIVRYVLRKELLQDIRGLRKEPRNQVVV